MKGKRKRTKRNRNAILVWSTRRLLSANDLSVLTACSTAGTDATVDNLVEKSHLLSESILKN